AESFGEAGIDGVDIANYVGLAGPKSIPAAVLQKLEAATLAACKSRDLEATFRRNLASVIGSTAAEYRAFIEQERAQQLQLTGATKFSISEGARRAPKARLFFRGAPDRPRSGRLGIRRLDRAGEAPLVGSTLAEGRANRLHRLVGRMAEPLFGDRAVAHLGQIVAVSGDEGCALAGRPVARDDD